MGDGAMCHACIRYHCICNCEPLTEHSMIDRISGLDVPESTAAIDIDQWCDILIHWANKLSEEGCGPYSNKRVKERVAKEQERNARVINKLRTLAKIGKYNVEASRSQVRQEAATLLNSKLQSLVATLRSDQ